MDEYRENEEFKKHDYHAAEHDVKYTRKCRFYSFPVAATTAIAATVAWHQKARHFCLTFLRQEFRAMLFKCVCVCVCV